MQSVELELDREYEAKYRAYLEAELREARRRYTALAVLSAFLFLSWVVFAGCIIATQILGN